MDYFCLPRISPSSWNPCISWSLLTASDTQMQINSKASLYKSRYRYIKSTCYLNPLSPVPNLYWWFYIKSSEHVRFMKYERDKGKREREERKRKEKKGKERKEKKKLTKCKTRNTRGKSLLSMIIFIMLFQALTLALKHTKSAFYFVQDGMFYNLCSLNINQCLILCKITTQLLPPCIFLSISSWLKLKVLINVLRCTFKLYHIIMWAKYSVKSTNY